MLSRLFFSLFLIFTSCLSSAQMSMDLVAPKGTRVEQIADGPRNRIRTSKKRRIGPAYKNRRVTVRPVSVRHLRRAATKRRLTGPRYKNRYAKTRGHR